MLRNLDVSRIALEITEHAAGADYDALLHALAPLRERGALLSIDEAGAGYASMRHILNFRHWHLSLGAPGGLPVWSG